MPSRADLSFPGLPSVHGAERETPAHDDERASGLAPVRRSWTKCERLVRDLYCASISRGLLGLDRSVGLGRGATLKPAADIDDDDACNKDNDHARRNQTNSQRILNNDQ